MRVCRLILGSCALFAAQTHASIGAAGGDRCGVGSLIWGSGQSISSQFSEESTNGSSSDSFSITSGTSGCSNSGIVKATSEEIHYVSINFEELLLDISQGGGETLGGLVSVMGCVSSAIEAIGSAAQAGLRKSSTSLVTAPLDLLHLVKFEVSANPALAAACAA